MKLLFFDTETTGVPKDYKAPVSDTANWPRLVQLGWLLTDIHGNIIKEGNYVIKPEGFVIPEEVTKIHGISQQFAEQNGSNLEDVIQEFLNDLNDSDIIVGHNISFDISIVGAELFRLGLDTKQLIGKKSICTMKTTVNLCKLPPHKGSTGYKWPRLQELHKAIFGNEFEDAHDAFADITATKNCFFSLLNKGFYIL